MKRVGTFALAVLAAMSAHSANMASQKWVDMRLREAGANAITNAVASNVLQQVQAVLANRLLITKATQPLYFGLGTNGYIYASFAPRNVIGLSVTNSANATITNGTLFAWAGNGVYTNAPIESAIFATQTNFVWNGIASTFADGVATFSSVPPMDAPMMRSETKKAAERGAMDGGGFSVVGIYMTAAEARAIKGE